MSTEICTGDIGFFWECENVVVCCNRTKLLIFLFVKKFLLFLCRHFCLKQRLLFSKMRNGRRRSRRRRKEHAFSLQKKIRYVSNIHKQSQSWLLRSFSSFLCSLSLDLVERKIVIITPCIFYSTNIFQNLSHSFDKTSIMINLLTTQTATMLLSIRWKTDFNQRLLPYGLAHPGSFNWYPKPNFRAWK